MWASLEAPKQRWLPSASFSKGDLRDEKNFKHEGETYLQASKIPPAKGNVSDVGHPQWHGVMIRRKDASAVCCAVRTAQSASRARSAEVK